MIKQQAYTLSCYLQVLPVAPNQTGRIVCNTFGLLFCPFSFAIGLSDSELLSGCRRRRRRAFFFCICFFCAPRRGDAIADFYFQGKTSLRVRTIAIPLRDKINNDKTTSVRIVPLLTSLAGSSKLDRVEPRNQVYRSVFFLS